MKKVFFFLLLVASLSVTAQTKVTKDSTGNYIAVTATKAKSIDTETGKMFTDSKGVKYPVYLTSTGRLVYYRTSAKTGNQYKVYLKL